MRTPEQAFKKYYASMSDADLLAIDQNRHSFIPVAQIALAAEMRRRRLAGPSAEQPPLKNPGAAQPTCTEAAAEIQGDTHKLHACASIGATEDQVSMVGTVPERVNKHGAKIEDMAGTGQHDSLGG